MSDKRRIFITGGASGIGRAVVDAVLAKGWCAVVADASIKALETCKAELAAFGKQVCFEPLDVTDEAAVIAYITRTSCECGTLRGVVNSAGIGADVPAVETSTALFRKMVEVNLIGSFVVAREAAKIMRQTGGSIVNIASVSGMRGNEGRVAYGASKGGVITMSQVLAVEFASIDVRVNVIAPGPIETPLVADIHTIEARQSWTTSVPQRRYGRPADIASAAVFLLDEAQSGYITGQTLAIDGGFTTAGLMTGTSAAATRG